MSEKSENPEQTIIRVAVVEDDREYRDGLVFLLNASAGLRSVAAVANGREAREELPALDPAPDVVLLDLDLGPGEPNGIECLPMLRALLPSAKFLMLTALDQPERVFEAVRRGAGGYLRKGSSLTELPAAIREVQAGYARLSPEVFQLIYNALQNPPPAEVEWAKLSPKEREILELQASGFEPKEIGDRLGIGYETFKTHSRHIREKLAVRTSQQAVRKVFPKKLFTLIPQWVTRSATL